MSEGLEKYVITGLIGIVGGFFMREFNRKDKASDDVSSLRGEMSRQLMEISNRFTNEIRILAERNTDAIEALNAAVSNLAISIAEQKAWFAGVYVSHDDLDEVEKRVKQQIEMHKLSCPLRGIDRFSQRGDSCE